MLNVCTKGILKPQNTKGILEPQMVQVGVDKLAA